MKDQLVDSGAGGNPFSAIAGAISSRVFYGYRSNPVLEIHHRGLGILHTCLQLAVLAYVIVSLIVFHKFAVFESPSVR